MSFQRLIGEIKKIKFQEVRTSNETYFEAVIPKGDLQTLEKTLTRHFGPPIKPAGVFAEGDANRYSRPYGGVRYEQTMYLLKAGGSLEFAFLWPWGCGTLVTLKAISQESGGPVSDGGFGGFLRSLFGK